MYIYIYTYICIQINQKAHRSSLIPAPLPAFAIGYAPSRCVPASTIFAGEERAPFAVKDRMASGGGSLPCGVVATPGGIVAPGGISDRVSTEGLSKAAVWSPRKENTES